MSGGGYQKHFDSSSIRSSADFFKVSMTSVAMNIIMSSKDALSGDNATSLFSWGGRIETWDSFIGIYYKKDDEHEIARNKYIALLKNRKLNPYAKDMATKLEIKRIYDEWFALVSTRLARFKIFPPLPVGYAQGIGEIQAEE